MSKTTIFYVCPACGRETAEPQDSAAQREVAPEQHDPTPAELKARPQVRDTARQILICRCGQRSTWFQLRDVTWKDRT